MKTTAILDLMVKDHARLLQLLKIAESHFRQDKDDLIKSFYTFEWNLEKHFFVEERAIFTSYNPDYIDEGYDVFLDLSNQHTKILEMIKNLKDELESEGIADISKLKKILIKHKNLEEKKVYPKLDQEINEGEKRFIIERINEII
jgi:hemerythrin-like domain-containing protein